MQYKVKKMAEDQYSRIKSYLNDQKPVLQQVSLSIWKNPELSFQEKFAHDCLTEFLQGQGFDVQKSYKIPTAFRADFSPSSYSKGPTIAILCEYDALPGIGHGCGHNLIATCGVSAGMAVKKFLEEHIGTIDAKLAVIGTPAEEGGGGKIELINAGAFDDISMALMAHPAPGNYAHCTGYLNNATFEVKFKGKTAHSANYPWNGHNALDAVVQCYVSISARRQSMFPDWRVHMIIVEGGKALNCIPDETSMKIQIRALAYADIKKLERDIRRCVDAAALASNCEATVTKGMAYKNVLSNFELAKTYRKYYEMSGEAFFDDDPYQKVITFGSTDMGDVSYIVPGIHPKFYVGKQVNDHTLEFAEQVKTDEALEQALNAATAIACTVIDVMTIEQLFNKCIEEFKTTKSLVGNRN